MSLAGVMGDAMVVAAAALFAQYIYIVCVRMYIEMHKCIVEMVFNSVEQENQI